MEYIYAALLIHKAGNTIDETNVTKVLTAAGVKVDEARVRALVAALDGMNIEEAIRNAAAAPAASTTPAGGAAPAAAKKEEKKEEKNEEAAAEGLGSLFG
jgi:large subunit ribosomal protein L12